MTMNDVGTESSPSTYAIDQIRTQTQYLAYTVELCVFDYSGRLLRIGRILRPL